MIVCITGLLAAIPAAAAGFRWGQMHEQRKRRAAMGLPPSENRGLGILAIVPPMERTCTECHKVFKCHPAIADKRCGPCIADAIDNAEDEWLEKQKQAGW